MSLLGNLFGDSNERSLKPLRELIHDINGIESEFQKMTDDELKEMTEKFRSRLHNGESLDDLLVEAFAAVREAAHRTLGKRHYDVQLLGGIVLHQGNIAEMKTGEGKTQVATLPLYINSLEDKGAHLVTPNDYLSRIGGGWMGPVYHLLGASIGVITHDFSGIYDPSYTDPHPHGDERLNHFRPCTRREAYMADITYGTNNEFAFDYLRDNLEQSPAQLRQRPHHYAIVDEVDSILIDEARTPLIISVPDQESGELYHVFARIIPLLKEGIDYNIDEKMRAVTITEEGINKVEKALGITNIYEEKGVRFVRHLESSLRAQALYQRDKDYVVKDGQVVIVDEFTGRLMPGRRWSEGLHQAIEAKEGVAIERESRTLATITFQNYFRLYKKLAGMTGTAMTSAEEFHKVYGLDTVTIPTHRPMVRRDLSDLIFRTEKGKFTAVVREVKERHAKGQPVLIGTVSIEKNERLSKMLSVEGIPHQMLNAKNHEQEALIIMQAGRRGAVTVATNMAGRGVDIILGGNPNPMPVEEQIDPLEDEVRTLGGLHVIGTERHEARRIDNQLRGRSGRQGDPGSSQFFVSFEDDLMRVFASPRIKSIMEALGVPEDEPIQNRLVTRALESAQTKIEGLHFDTRKHVLEFDDVLNKQRETIYRLRREILFAHTSNHAPPLTLKEQIKAMFDDQIQQLVEFHCASGNADEWNTEEIFETLRAAVGVSDSLHGEFRNIVATDEREEEKRLQIIERAVREIRERYDARERELGNESMREIERSVMLRSIDTLWMDHLDQMEHLRDSVRLRAYGQREPLVEYKNEGTKLFRELQQAIRAQIASMILKVEISAPSEQSARRPTELHRAPSLPPTPEAVQHPSAQSIANVISQNNPTEKEPNRNDPCSCGSGKKYKKCHGS